MVMVAVLPELTVVMLAVELQAVATLALPLKPLIAAHCTLVPVVQLPEVTTDHFEFATPVAGAVPQVAVLLLHRISTLLFVPSKVPVRDCICCVMRCSWLALLWICVVRFSSWLEVCDSCVWLCWVWLVRLV